MPSRREFVTTAAALGMLGATPQPVPTPSATPPPSRAARAFAAGMRRFDAALSESDLDEIAAGIEMNWALGESLNPKGTALKNADQPMPSFSVKLP